MRGVLVRNPVGKTLYQVDAATVGTHILDSAWKEIEDSLPAACDAMEILNTTGGLMKMAVGAAGLEIEFPFYIMPSVEPHIIPVNLSKGDRITVKAVESTDITDTGDLAINWFG
jgi:hypothetical protein